MRLFWKENDEGLNHIKIPFKQSVVLRNLKEKPHPLFDLYKVRESMGFCFGITLEAFRMIGSEDAKTPEQACIKVIQKVQNQEETSGLINLLSRIYSLQNYTQTFIRKYHNKKTALTKENLEQVISKSGFALLSLKPLKGHGHTIAIIEGDEKTSESLKNYRIFDPSFGLSNNYSLDEAIEQAKLICKSSFHTTKIYIELCLQQLTELDKLKFISNKKIKGLAKPHHIFDIFSNSEHTLITKDKLISDLGLQFVLYLIKEFFNDDRIKLKKSVLKLIEYGFTYEELYAIVESLFLYAVENNEIEAVKKFIELGVDINFCDWYGFSALMIAAEKGYVDIVKLLLEIPTLDIDAKTIMDGTAYNLAKDPTIAKMIEDESNKRKSFCVVSAIDSDSIPFKAQTESSSALNIAQTVIDYSKTVLANMVSLSGLIASPISQSNSSFDRTH